MDIKEQTQRLREAAADARELGTVNTELFVQMLHQLLNSFEGAKSTARDEKESLIKKIGQCEGMIKAAGQHQDLLIATLEAYNQQERKSREEQVRFEAEQKEKLEAQKEKLEAQKVAAGTDTVRVTPEQAAEHSTPTEAVKKVVKKTAKKKGINLKKGKKGANKAD